MADPAHMAGVIEEMAVDAQFDAIQGPATIRLHFQREQDRSYLSAGELAGLSSGELHNRGGGLLPTGLRTVLMPTDLAAGVERALKDKIDQLSSSAANREAYIGKLTDSLLASERRAVWAETQLAATTAAYQTLLAEIAKAQPTAPGREMMPAAAIAIAAKPYGGPRR